MPQVHLPLFPNGVIEINSHLGFECRDGKVSYFFGAHPIFIHEQDDLQSFRMITSQFIVTGNARSCEIIKAFSVPASTVKRYTKLYRDEGPSGFYKTAATRGPSVLTQEVLEKAQHLLDTGQNRAEVAESLDIKLNTLSKAVTDGRLHEPFKKKSFPR